MKKISRESQGQYERMTTAPVSELILSLAVPSMVTTLINSVYNLADTFFVGQVGTSATAAVGVVFSIPMILNALGFWVGTGGSNLVSRMLGAKQQKEADITMSTAFFLSFFFGLLVAVIGFVAGEPLMLLLGATETNLPYAMSYGRFIFVGAPFSASSLALSQCLRAEGKSRQSMNGQVAGGVLNMLLDPLFIFVFHWGISGAALATAISQIIAWHTAQLLSERKDAGEDFLALSGKVKEPVSAVVHHGISKPLPPWLQYACQHRAELGIRRLGRRRHCGNECCGASALSFQRRLSWTDRGMSAGDRLRPWNEESQTSEGCVLVHGEDRHAQYVRFCGCWDSLCPCFDRAVPG